MKKFLLSTSFRANTASVDWGNVDQKNMSNFGSIFIQVLYPQN